MKVIPVIDILNGKVVHAFKGQRKEYRPLQSSLISSVDPLTVAKAFKDFGFTDLYVADLDAIVDCSTQFYGLEQIFKETNLKLTVDAGITNIERAQKLIDSGVSKLVVGTETLQSLEFVSQAVDQFGRDRVVVSLDLRGERVLVNLGFETQIDPMFLLQRFRDMGVSEVIVLDLTRVGSGEGVNVPFLKKVMQEIGVKVYAGGGVRDIADLEELSNIGVSGVLIATALHSGKISVTDLKQRGFL